MNDLLGKRMKENYEQAAKYKLVHRMPVIIRIDGKAFHTFCRHFQKPFDHYLMQAMQETMQYLCENIQGCVLGYTQSDEISLLLIDYKRLGSSAWFDNEVQKICSISASMATLFFNSCFRKMVDEYTDDFYEAWNRKEEEEKYVEVLNKAVEKGALFDARCFNVPKEEVTNYFYWRQVDAIRNSVQMVAQANFSHNELQHKSTNEIKEKLLTEKGIDFMRDFSLAQQRGVCCIRKQGPDDGSWQLDMEIPVFKGDGRQYIDSLLDPDVE